MIVIELVFRFSGIPFIYGSSKHGIMITISTKEGKESEYHLKKKITKPGEGFTIPENVIFQCEEGKCFASTGTFQAAFDDFRSITIMPSALTNDGLRMSFYATGLKPLGMLKKNARCVVQRDRAMDSNRVVCAGAKFFKTDKWVPVIV